VLQELEAGLEGSAGIVLVGRGDAEHGQDRATDQPLGGAAPGLQHLRHQPGAPVQLQPGLLRVDRARGGEDVKQDNGDELERSSPCSTAPRLIARPAPVTRSRSRW
jgi:hypothetical protein